MHDIGFSKIGATKRAERANYLLKEYWRNLNRFKKGADVTRSDLEEKFKTGRSLGQIQNETHLRYDQCITGGPTMSLFTRGEESCGPTR